MPLTAKNVFAKAARSSTTRKIGWWIAGIVVFVAVAGFLIAPPLVKSQLEKELSTQLHRRTTVERIRINPFALTLTVQGFVVRERGGEEPVLSFEELHADASITSLYHLAPVAQALRLVKPRVRVVRNDDKTYNFQDLIDEFLARPAGPTPHFSLNNIEVIDGRIDIDDRPEKQQHQVTDIKFGIPFVSSLPYATKIKVQPALSAKIDGAPFGLTGETRPFENTRETTLAINLDALQLARFLDYSPVPVQVKLASGQLDTRLKLAFAMLDNKPHRLTVAGTLALSKIDVRDPGGGPLLALPELTLEIEALDVLGQSVKIKSARIDGVEAYVKRLKDSSFNVMSFLQATAKGAPVEGKTKTGIPPDANPPPSAQPAKPFEFAIADIEITNSTLHLEDEVPAQPVRTLLQNIEFSMQGLSNARDAKAAGRLAFKSDTLNAFSWTGNVQLEPMQVDGKLDVSGLRLAALRPYYASLLDLDIVQGTLDVATSFSASQDAGKLQAQVSDLTAAVKSLQTRLPGDKDMLARISALEVKGVAADFAKHSLTVSGVNGRDASVLVVRDKDGRINLTRILKPAPAPAPADAGGGSGGAPWDVRVKQVAFDRAAIDYRDLGQKAPNTVSVSELAFTGANFSNAKNAKAQVNIRANINKTGKLALSGPVSIDPLSLVLNVETTALDLLPVQPLVADKLNIAITGGALSAKGALTLDAPAGAPVKATYKGALEVTDFASVDNLTLEDLLKWKSLRIDGIDASLEPLQAAVTEITLAEFYSRLIVNADGTINLQNIVKKPGEPAVQGTSPPVASDAKPAAANQARPPASKAAAPAQAGEGVVELPNNLSIGKITLQNGAVNFTDHFIKPNYSADLSEITGSVGKMTRDTPGDVELTGHVQKTAPLVIAGRVNPLAKDLFLDIKASAKDVELPPLTAYSIKYAGYGIEKGKLSMDVKYHLENRKLGAENHVNLDQLTFGKKVDSPTATKLPVLLAVALLKDRNGVIDINLPISGSLDDPQFSMGGIIGRVIVNLLVKIITSPFALIGSLFGGGGGEELAYVEFAPGRAAITPDAAKKLGTVAKGLNDRPALKMDITGRADADSDREGLRQASVERKVKAQKLKATLKSGEAAPSLDDIKIEPGEYEKYLTAAYREEKFTKPRNLIGLAKSLPVPEMEKLMLENAQVADDDLQQLADQRAQAVKDNLVRTGKIEAERVFLTASKTSAAGITDKGKPNRADFALR
jgi:hypothetical protein